jgi:hypothetical protein
MRNALVVITVTMTLCSSALAMATWLKCHVTSSACMTMMDGSVGYCYEESCSAVLFAYTE